MGRHEPGIAQQTVRYATERQHPRPEPIIVGGQRKQCFPAAPLLRTGRHACRERQHVDAAGHHRLHTSTHLDGDADAHAVSQQHGGDAVSQDLHDAWGDLVNNVPEGLGEGLVGPVLPPRIPDAPYLDPVTGQGTEVVRPGSRRRERDDTSVRRTLAPVAKSDDCFTHVRRRPVGVRPRPALRGGHGCSFLVASSHRHPSCLGRDRAHATDSVAGA